MTYKTTTGETPDMLVGIQTSGADYTFLVNGFDLEPGGAITTKLDTGNGTFSLDSTGNTSASSYSLYLSRVDDAGEQVFGSNEINLNPDDSVYVEYLTWPGNGQPLAVKVDQGGDGSVDTTVELEAAAAAQEGIGYDLISFERLVHDHNPLAATRRVGAANQQELAIYRGWMLRPDAYRQLYDALGAKGLRLINTPAAYRHCHLLPESYPVIEPETPRTVWLPYDADFSIDRVMALLTPFGAVPVIVKDYVKSRKHEWNEACYLPAANDRASVERVVSRFLTLQGEDLNESLVFRAYEGFQPIGRHSKSGMPLTLEWRCFVLDGTVLTTSAYWEEGVYGERTPPRDLFGGIIRQVQCRLFTMDIAQRTDGTWRIVELGDGQVAGLPETLDPAEFYRPLIQRLRAAEDPNAAAG